MPCVLSLRHAPSHAHEIALHAAFIARRRRLARSLGVGGFLDPLRVGIGEY